MEAPRDVIAVRPRARVSHLVSSASLFFRLPLIPMHLPLRVPFCWQPSLDVGAAWGMSWLRRITG